MIWNPMGLIVQHPFVDHVLTMEAHVPLNEVGDNYEPPPTWKFCTTKK
jgi:hypothetical protein